MPTNLDPDIAALPLYQLGFHDGQDVGLRIALDVITQERIRQTNMQATHDAASPAAACHEYAAARLVDVSKVIGARFRQCASSEPRQLRQHRSRLPCPDTRT